MIRKTIDEVKAISCKTGSWVYGIGVYPVLNDDSKCVLIKLENLKITTEQVLLKTVCKYIGKLDVDKNPIYENDIVEAKTPYGELNKTIVWDNDRCGYFLQSDFVAYDPKNLYSLAKKKVKVIGNIFN